MTSWVLTNGATESTEDRRRTGTGGRLIHRGPHGTSGVSGHRHRGTSRTLESVRGVSERTPTFPKDLSDDAPPLSQNHPVPVPEISLVTTETRNSLNDLEGLGVKGGDTVPLQFSCLEDPKTLLNHSPLVSTIFLPLIHCRR